MDRVLICRATFAVAAAITLCCGALAQGEWVEIDGAGTADLEIIVAAPDLARLSGRLAAHVDESGNSLGADLTPGHAALYQTIGGKTEALASAPLPRTTGPGELVLHRRGGLLRLSLGAAVVCQAYTRAVMGGVPAYVASSGLDGAEITVQPLGEIEYTESFAWERDSQAAKAWEVVQGDWTNAKAGDWTNPNAIRRQQARTSANLFAYQGSGDPFGLVVTGFEHWTGYELKVAAKTLAGGAIGLIAYYNGPGDYILFRATCQTAPSEDRGRFQLIHVRDGVNEVLTETDGGVVDNAWYELAIRTTDSSIMADIDSVNVLAVHDFTALSRGRIGLYCEGTGGAKFDDASVSTYRYFADDFAEGATARWEGMDSGWTAGSASASRGHVLRRQAGHGLVLGGDDRWENYRLGVDVDLVSGPGAVVFNYEDPDNYNALRYDPGGACSVVRVREGTEAVLDSGALTPDASGWCHIAVALRDEFVRVTDRNGALLEGIDDQAFGGRFGLEGGAGARFDKVYVRPVSYGTHDIISEQFSKEDSMREWARVSGQWVTPTGPQTEDKISWNKGDFYGDCEVVVSLARLGEAGRSATVILGGDGESATSGYGVRIGAADDGTLGLELTRAGETVERFDGLQPGLPAELRIARFGSLIWVSLAGDTQILYRDDRPLTGSAIGLLQGGFPMGPSSAATRAHNDFDYTFSSAPTEWFVRGGTWDVTSRWTCQPEWTWFSGVSDGPAPMWSKREFGGDITVELYASLKMTDEADAPGHGYQHPHDLNVTLCGDGKSVSSGYAFVIGGYLGSKTQILKNGEVLAETDDPDAMMPSLCDGMPGDMNQFHRHWWQIRPQKHGDRVRLYFENKLVLEATDPDPIDAGHVALWTWNGAIMVARAHIYGHATGEIMQPKVSETALLGAMDRAGAHPSLTLTSSTHKGMICDFEGGRGEFATVSGNLGASLCIEPTGSPTGDACLRVENEEQGGDFAVKAMDTDFRIQDATVLSFDYRIDPSTRVDILLRGPKGSYIVRFTGPEQVTPGQILLGSIDDVQTDGRWHSASFDLASAFLAKEGDFTNDRITEVLIGNFNHDRELSLGLTGNPAGATYWLDNFGIRTGGGADAQFSIADQNKLGAQGISYVVDQTQDTVPPAHKLIEGASGEIALEGLRSGVWYVHAAVCDADGAWGEPLHHRFIVDGEAPQVGKVSSADLQAAMSGTLALPVVDTGSGINPASIRVDLDGRELTPESGLVGYDSSRAAVTVNLARLDQPFADGQRVTVSLARIEDRVGNVAVSSEPAILTIDYAADKEPPLAPRITSGGVLLCNDTFETDDPADMGEWAPVAGTGAEIAVDDTTAASGGRSLKLYCTNSAGMFQVTMRQTPFDAGRYRVLSFDYRIDPWIRVDMVVQTADNVYRAIRLTDRDTEYPLLSTSTGIVADGQWRHAEIDLYGILREKLPMLSSYEIRTLRIGGSGWPGNAKGASYNIDNFRVMSVASARDALRFEWTAHDVTGIGGASYVLDANGTTEPDTTVNTTDMVASFEEIPEGPVCFHVRLVDGAGNWGPAMHHWCFIDNRGISVTDLKPEPGSTRCSSTISMVLTDAGAAGVDPTSIRLAVAGREYTLENEGLTFEASSGELRFEASHVSPEPVSLPDQAVIPVELVSAADFAGNGLEDAVAFSWTMDYSTDDTPPPAPVVVSTSHPTAFFDPFEGAEAEGALGEWRGSGGSVVEIDTTTKASGDSSLKFTFERGKICRAEVRRTPFDVSRYPFVSFDYKVPKETQLDLLFVVNNSQVLVSFTDQERSARSRIPGVIADDEWHQVRNFDLATAARLVLGREREMRCTLIAFIDAGRLETPVGSSLWIDNFAVYRPGKGEPRLRWQSADPTGIAGYSYVFDSVPGTIPDDEFEAGGASLVLPEPEPGVHYFHIKARDGAGHWSPTTHYAIVQR